MLNYGVIYIYKAHLFSPDACTCHFSEMVFSLVYVAFFFVDTLYEVSTWTESQEDDETTLQVYKFLIW